MTASDRLPTIDAVWLRQAAAAVVVHPSLWGTGLVQLARLARKGWWRRPPHLPLPDPEYLAFRLQTMYGDPTRRFEPADLVAYLQWCRRMRGVLR